VGKEGVVFKEFKRLDRDVLKITERWKLALTVVLLISRDAIFFWKGTALLASSKIIVNAFATSSNLSTLVSTNKTGSADSIDKIILVFCKLRKLFSACFVYLADSEKI
jgi:hypothetical protein